MSYISEKLLADLLEKDAIYQQLLTDCSVAETAYMQILHRFPEQDQHAVEHYISLCEELDHRKLILALEWQGQ